MMDKEKFRTLKHKAIEICEIKFNCEYYIDSDFDFNFKEDKVEENGLLNIGEIKSSDVVFMLRWDEKDNSIDIDMKDLISGKISKNGFLGHHTKRIIGEDVRTYHINIEKDNKKIFEGDIGVIIKSSTRLDNSLKYCIINKNGDIR